MSAPQDPVLLLCAHGSTSRSAQIATEEITASVAQALPGIDVILTWVDVQEPDVVDRCEEFADRPVVIVPLLLSAGFHVHQDLARAVAGRSHHVVTGALGPDRSLSELMARRIAHAEARTTAVRRPEAAPALHEALVASSAETAAPAIVLVAAGSSDDRAVQDVRRQAADLAELTGRDVRTGFVSAAEPRARDAVAGAWSDGARDVTTVSFHVAPGVFHADAVRGAQTAAEGLPATSARAGGRVTEPLLVDGTEVPPELVDVVLKRWEEGKALLP